MVFVYRTGEKPTLKELPEDLRPRERLFKEGAGSLSDAELLAILLRTGSKEATALDLAALIMAKFQNLKRLVDASVEELAEIKGVGMAKACQVKAALELARRLARCTESPRPSIKSPDDAAALVMEEMRCLDREHFRVLLLNTKNQVVGVDEVSVGTLNYSAVHPREIFRGAIKRSAASVILVHNHPSGDPAPSREDIEVTQRLVEAGKIVGIQVLDHIVVGEKRYVSLKAEGLI